MRPVLDYSLEEMASIDRGIKLVFARDGVRPARHVPYRVRFHDMLEAFTIYPRNDRDLSINKLLWHAVRDSSFQSRLWPSKLVSTNLDENSHGQDKTDRDPAIFALGIPEQLVNYLQNVTLTEMQESILCMLADAARGENREGLKLMREELAPSIWENLELLLVEGRSSVHRETQPHAPASGAAASNGSRRLPVEDTSPLTREGDERHSPLPKARPLLRGHDGNQDSCLYASCLLDQALHIAQDQNYWQITITGATFEPATVLRPETHDNDQAVVIHSLYNDWKRNEKNRLLGSKVTPASPAARGTKRPASPLSTALEPGGMLELIAPATEGERYTQRDKREELRTIVNMAHKQRQEETRKRAVTVIISAESRQSQLVSLPNHTLTNNILPNTMIDQRRLDSPTEKSVSTFQTIDLSPIHTNQSRST